MIQELDLATAEKAIRDALQTKAGQKLLKNVIQFSRNKSIIRFERVFDLNRNLGKGFESVNGIPKLINEGLQKIKLVIETDGKGGFQIISSYPVK